MSLAKQCEEISIDLNDVVLDYIGRPEQAALGFYRAQGYIGTFNEGITMHTVLKALMLDKLAEFNTFDDRNDACCRYLEAQLTIHKEVVEDIIATDRYKRKLFAYFTGWVGCASPI